MTKTKDINGGSVLAIITPVTVDQAGQLPHPDHTLPGPGSAGGEHPDIGGPGDQPTPTHPIYFPPDQAEHPIVLPPPVPVGPGEPPPVGGVDPVPPEVPEDITERFDVKVGWTEETGWVVVFVPTGNVPTPSA